MIKDKYELQGFGKPKMPKLKGHVKLILRDNKTGKIEVSEGDNIVTDAVYDIAGANIMGCVDYRKMFGTEGLWKTWFGGVLVFESAHANLDADKYGMPSNSNNLLVAHAGQTSIDENHDDDSTRGNPSASEYVPTSNSMKMVFEWGRQKGNGTIRSLSLCHSDVGSYGTGSNSYHFANSFSPFELLQSSDLSGISSSFNSTDNLVAQYDDYHGIGFVIGDGTTSGDEGWYSGHTEFETKKLTCYIRRLPYTKFGLFETVNAKVENDIHFTIPELPFYLYSMPCFYFEPSTKYLWIFTNVTGIDGNRMTWNNRVVRYCKIDTINQEVVELETGVYSKTIQSDTDIPPLSYHRRASSMNFRYTNIIKEGDYVYIPSTSGVNWSGYFDSGEDMHIDGYKKINIETNINTAITFGDTEDSYFKPAMKCGDLFVSSGSVVNDDRFPCVNQFEEFYGLWAIQSPNKASSLVIPNRSNSNVLSKPRYIAANKLLLTTKYNLDQPVTKDINKSMTVEYTLTEVSGS